jgi:ABC-type nitrate/sulfonate/bicarbonate transport system ATPase subunit
MRSWYCDMAHDLGIATLAITHDVDEAVSMASRIYVLDGTPSAGVPSHIAEEVQVPRATEGQTAAEFALTPEFLQCKRHVLELLGE